MTPLDELVSFVTRFSAANPRTSKAEVAEAAAEAFGLTRVRSLYVGPAFSVRFSVAGGSGLSKTHPARSGRLFQPDATRNRFWRAFFGPSAPSLLSPG